MGIGAALFTLTVVASASIDATPPRSVPLARLVQEAMVVAAPQQLTQAQQEMADALDQKDRGVRRMIGGGAAIVFGLWVAKNGTEPCDDFHTLLEVDCGQTKLSLLGWGIFGVGGLYTAAGVHDFLAAQRTITSINSGPRASISLAPDHVLAVNLGSTSRVSYRFTW